MNESTAPAAAPAKTAKFLRKLSPKTICDEVGLDLGKLGDTRPVAARVLYDLFGVTNRVKQGTTDKGAWVAFQGEFEAVTPDGEIFSSGRAHIPVVEDMLFGALSAAQAEDAKARVEIAVRVSIKPAPSGKPSATGYEYDVQNLIPTKPSNAIANMRAIAAQSAPALPAPTPKAGPAPKK